jgi:hypothetical protein
MAYYKVRFEVWCDRDPTESDLERYVHGDPDAEQGGALPNLRNHLGHDLGRYKKVCLNI